MAIARPRAAAPGACSFIPSRSAPSTASALIANFLALTPPRRRRTRRARRCAAPRRARPAATRCTRPARSHVAHRASPAPPDAERAFAALFGERGARVLAGLEPRRPERCRASRSWARRGGRSAREIRYRRRASSASTVDARRRDRGATTRRCLRLPRARARAPAHDHARSCRSTSTAASSATSATSSRPTAAPPPRTAPSCPTRSCCSPTGIVAFDHELGAGARARARRPATPTRHAARALDRRDRRARSRTCPSLDDAAVGHAAGQRCRSSLRRGREHYMANVEACKRLLEAGESYEICLTNRIAPARAADPFALLPRAAPREPGALRRLPAHARGRDPRARRPSASCACAATGRSRRSRSRARPAAPCRPDRRRRGARRACAAARRTAPSTS